MSWGSLIGDIDPIFGSMFGHRPDTTMLGEVVERPYEEWLNKFFPDRKGFAPRHRRAWEWFSSIAKGTPPPSPEVEIWPRGGGKSTTIEMALSWIGSEPNPRRNFALIVSGKQDQADQRVQAISGMLEKIGVGRSVNKYGNSKGWRRDQLRTATGFNVAGIGLDVAARGFKFDEYRPDLIIVDDIDDTEDTERTTAKKERALTRKIFPAGSHDCAIFCVQNLIIPDGVFARLYDGRADFLQTRQTYLEKAVIGLETDIREQADGTKRYVVTAGEPTWEGQDLETCERQINERGLRAFLIESQHEVTGLSGWFFETSKLIAVDELPFTPAYWVRAWDFAATQAAGDFTVGALMCCNKERTLFTVVDVVRAQLSPENVDTLVRLTQAWDEMRGVRVKARIPQDPGAAGKTLAARQEREYGAESVAVTGSKASRATGLAKSVNPGNVCFLKEQERPKELADFLNRMTNRTSLDGKSHLWHDAARRELDSFREDMSHLHDDIVDALADAHDELSKPEREWAIYF